jgi:Icc-related predicted phosphoesterase
MHRYFSDRHFEDIDMVIHSGDCSNYKDPYRNANEVLDFIEWYRCVPVKHKIYVAGNHDTSIERRLVRKEHFTGVGITYLENESIEIEGYKIWGSPITPTFNEWAFMKARDKTHKVWATIPDDTDIIIVHGPPKGIRDISESRERVLEFCGDRSLRTRVMEISPMLMCFGHIHNYKEILNQGTSKFGDSRTIYSNAACVEDGRFEKGLISFGNIINLNK